MRRCKVCNTIVVGSTLRDGADSFCSLYCFTKSTTPGFCKDCLDATTPKSPGSTYLYNGIGTRLLFAKDRCPTCHSVVQTKFFVLAIIPLIPLGRFRLIYTDRLKYVGRQVVRTPARVSLDPT
jgi:hypothetical protein